MAKWYEIPAEQRDVDQQRQCQDAHCTVLLKTEKGREVMCDFLRRIKASHADVKEARDSDLALGQLWLDCFWNETVRLCGATDAMAMIEYLPTIAAKWQPREPEPPYKAEDHSE